MRLLLLFASLVLLLSACTSPAGRQRMAALHRADSLLSCQPAAALAIADSLLADAPTYSHVLPSLFQGEELEWGPRLVRLAAYNKLDTVFTAAHVAEAKALADWFDHHGTPNQQMTAHYLLGRTYADTGEAPQAIEAYNDAAAKADTTAADCDYRTLGCVYAQMAEVYHRQLLLSNEIEARRNAQHYAYLAKDTVGAISGLNLMAGVYILQNKLDSAELLLNEAIAKYRENGYEQDALQASTMLMHLFMNRSDKNSELKRLIDRYEAESELFDIHHELPNSRRQYYRYIGKYYENIGQLDSAEFFYRKIFRENMSFCEYDPMYKGLLSVFSKRLQADSIAKYAWLYCAVNDSSIALKDQALTAQMAATYNYGRYQREARQSESKAAKYQLLLACAAALLFLSLLIFKHYQAKQEEKRRLLRETINEYEQKLRTLELLECTHKQVIGEASAALADVTAKNEQAQKALNKANRKYEIERAKLMEEIESLNNKIHNYRGSRNLFTSQNKSKEIENDSFVLKLKETEKRVQKLTDDDKEELNSLFSKYYPELLFDLNRQAKFNKNDIIICLLCALKFKPGTIVNMTGLSYSIVTNTRTKINEILFGDKSAPSLYAHLMEKYDI